MTPDEIKPMNNDLLLKHHDLDEYRESPIYLPRDTKRGNDLHYFEVMKISPNVESVKEGDTVLVHWAETMPAFMLDDMVYQYTITSEDKLCAVVEDEVE